MLPSRPLLPPDLIRRACVAIFLTKLGEPKVTRADWWRTEQHGGIVGHGPRPRAAPVGVRVRVGDYRGTTMVAGWSVVRRLLRRHRVGGVGSGSHYRQN